MSPLSRFVPCLDDDDDDDKMMVFRFFFYQFNVKFLIPVTKFV